jgi:hypothetical protein
MRLHMADKPANRKGETELPEKSPYRKARGEVVQKHAFRNQRTGIRVAVLAIGERVRLHATL